MKIHDVMQHKHQLLEFIEIGKIQTHTHYTFVFIFDVKHMVLVNANSFEETGIKDGAHYVVNATGMQALYNYFMQAPMLDFDENQEYESFREALSLLDQEKIKSIILNNLTNKIPTLDDEIDKYFRNILHNRPTSYFIDEINRSLVYGFGIKTTQQLSKMLSNTKNKLDFHPAWSGDYIVIDHVAKTIDRHGQDKQLSSRMTRYSGNAEYVLTDSEYSMSRQDYIKIMRQLQHDPMLKNYAIQQFPDASLQQYQKFLDSLKSIMQNHEITAYHGTSMSIWRQIQKDKFMMPDRGPNYEDKLAGHSEHLVYLTLNPETAIKYAVRASGASNYVILKIKLKIDASKVVFDEDSLRSAVHAVFASTNKTDKHVCDAVKKVFAGQNPWSDNDAWARHVMYILRQSEDKYSLDNLTPQQCIILDYFKNKALIALVEGSFGYRGKIPLSSISLYETGKSQNVRNASNQEYVLAYHDMIAKRKRFPGA